MAKLSVLPHFEYDILKVKVIFKLFKKEEEEKKFGKMVSNSMLKFHIGYFCFW